VAQRPRLIFSAFNEFVVSHHDHGLWAYPGSRQVELNSVDYWVDVARLLERGRFDLLFFADVLAPYDIYRGSREAALRSGMQAPVNDPAVLIPVLAYATRDLGFAMTENILQEPPYTFARKVSTMDHLSRGRIAWNIVTSFLPGAGRNLGHGGLPSHEERYGRAEDYVAAVYKLWEASWEDDAVLCDRERQHYIDPAKVHEIHHHGPYYDVVGPHLTEPSPQRTPLLFQAAQSDVGIGFAGRHAEILFTSFSRQAAPASVAKLRAAAVAAGRHADQVRIFGGFSFVLGSTEAEARRLARELSDRQSLESILTKFSGFWNFDLARFELEDRVADILNGEVPAAASLPPIGRQALAAAPDKSWSFERFARWIASQHAVGTPEAIVDEIAAWQEAGVDGLNIYYQVSPQTYEDFVNELTPRLTARGIMQERYAPGTLRHKIFGRGPYLPPEHPARRTREALAAARAEAVAA
jgi:FMN-dependent oxidoreductase (nitrilotriacetate monooxygenase family)